MPNVSYEAIMSIDGQSVLFTSVDISPEFNHNIYQMLKPIGPVESYAGPIRISGTITCPMYGFGSTGLAFFKRLAVSTTGHELVIRYGPGGRVEKYAFVVKSTTFSCAPGGYVTCNLSVMGYSLEYSNRAIHLVPLNTAISGLILFNRTSLGNNHFPYIDPDRISGWSLTIERQWDEYWYWNYSSGDFLLRLPQHLMPGNINVSGTFLTIDPFPIAEYCGFLFDMGRYYSDENFIEVHKTQITNIPAPASGPNDRIVQNVKFITLSDGYNGYINGQYNGLIS